MSKLLGSWPYYPTKPVPGMAYQAGDRVIYHGAPGTVTAFDAGTIDFWYVQLDENAGKGATRCHVSSLEKVDD